ncbi:MAG: hypothetical protein LUG18_07445 [Candidatus Azobacteroides sp.]|nr:hypothetical protein [Candidatus Azobacteroides sp.]
MKWKKSFFNFSSLLLLIGLLANTESLHGEVPELHTLNNCKTIWSSLRPDYIKLQYAGGMGFLSAGAGWNYGKSKKWETDLLLGFLPEFSDEKKRITFTIKQNFTPWHVSLKNRIQMNPFTCGIYANTILGSDYWIWEPEKYPSDYYSFSTKIRFHIFVGQRFTYSQNQQKKKNLTLYYEISSNELYIISAWGNKYLKPNDYLHLSLGLKWDIF